MAALQIAGELGLLAMAASHFLQVDQMVKELVLFQEDPSRAH